MEFEPKIKACCFTGHRPQKLYISEELAKELLRKEITAAIKEDYKIFISGMASGIDVWAAEVVLEERKKFPDIKLVCAMPYPDFIKNRASEERERGKEILECADAVRSICPHYSTFCFHERNMWLVDNSQRVIAAYCGLRGGTHNTIAYAERKGIEIVNILCDTDEAEER